MGPCKSIDLNFLQIYTGIGSAPRHKNQRFMLNALPWVNKCQELELFNAILLLYLFESMSASKIFHLWNENSHLIQNNYSSNLFMLTTVGFINSSDELLG